ncbi:MAG TPA: DUF4199 domain-containing protein [Candidatus Sulfotelmatobacter sp.]|jgi:hypothetical protein|nr:DUF4199 domain-containing protein [Candidatus Sulfotelmatobacter sp.]
MKKTVLIFGLISGALSAVMMVLTVPFVDKIGFEKGEILGYTTIVLSALMVFFGVRSYRENAGGGRLTFGRGFAVGILITLISNACYVGTWEILRYTWMPDFAEKYAAHMVEHAKASGANQQKVAETEEKAKQFKVMYDNPAINVAMTFMEVFPIGLVVTLASAGILRKKVSEPGNLSS